MPLVIVSRQDAPSVTHRLFLDPSVSLEGQIAEACEHLPDPAVAASATALLSPSRLVYLSDEEWPPDWLEEGDAFQLVPSAATEVEAAITELRAFAADGGRHEKGLHSAVAHDKARVFWMRNRLQIGAWAEEFVAQDGSERTAASLESPPSIISARARVTAPSQCPCAPMAPTLPRRRRLTRPARCGSQFGRAACLDGGAARHRRSKASAARTAQRRRPAPTSLPAGAATGAACGFARRLLCMPDDSACASVACRWVCMPDELICPMN